MALEKSNNENEAGNDESSLILAKSLLASETFPEGDIVEWMNADGKQEITDDKIAGLVENSEQARVLMKTMSTRRK